MGRVRDFLSERGYYELDEMGSTGYTCLRHTFCSLNVFLWLAGCAVLGAGLWLRFGYMSYDELLPQYSILSVDILCIVAGATMFVIAFFGCCGAWFQSRCMLGTYFSLVVFLFLVEFLMSGMGFLFRGALGHSVNEELRVGIAKHYVESPVRSDLAIIWEHAQRQFECCGVTGPEDWFDVKAWPGQNYVPKACCLPKFRNVSDCHMQNNPEMWFSKGCSQQVQMWFAQRLEVLGIVGLVIAFVQLFGLLSSLLLFCTVRHKQRNYKAYEQS